MEAARAAAEVPAGSVLEAGWQETAEGRELLGALLRERRRGRRRRRAFFGIQSTTVLWPAKLRESGRALFFRFSFWDCGEAVLRKFDHILTSCVEKADGALLLFSFTDRASFEDLPNQISRLEAQGPGTAPVKMVVGTKFDQFAHTDVTERDVATFRRTWGLPVLRVKSVGAPRPADGRTPDGWAGPSDVAHLLNRLAEHLWRQDQVAAGLFPPPHPGQPTPHRVTLSRGGAPGLEEGDSSTTGHGGPLG